MAIIPIFFVRNQLQRVLSGELRIREMNASDLIMNFGYLAFLLVMLIALDLGLVGAIPPMLIGEALSLVFLLRRALQPRTSAPAPGGAAKLFESADAASGARPTLGELWGYGRWNYLLMLSNFLVEELPLLLLKSISGDSTPVGLMSRAQRLSREPRNVAFTISQVLFPYTAASEEAAATRRTNLLARNSIALVGVFVLGLALFIRPILLLLYGEEFVPAAGIFYALSPSTLIWPMGHLLAIHIAASGEPRKAFVAGFSVMLCAVLLCPLVIPLYGAVGAGLCATAIYVVRAGVLVVTYRRLTGSSLSQVLFVQRGDLGHYRRLLEVIRPDRRGGDSAQLRLGYCRSPARSISRSVRSKTGRMGPPRSSARLIVSYASARSPRSSRTWARLFKASAAPGSARTARRKASSDPSMSPSAWREFPRPSHAAALSGQRRVAAS